MYAQCSSKMNNKPMSIAFIPINIYQHVLFCLKITNKYKFHLFKVIPIWMKCSIINETIVAYKYGWFSNVEFTFGRSVDEDFVCIGLCLVEESLNLVCLGTWLKWVVFRIINISALIRYFILCSHYILKNWK